MGNPALFYAPLNGSLAFQDRAGGGTLTGSGAVRYAAASGARINLMRNPSAATTATNMWVATTGGSMSRVTDSVLGATAYRVAATSSANSGAIFWRSAAVPAVFQISSKVAHTFAADVALVSGTANWQVMFYELDAAGTVLGAALGVTSITPTASGSRIVVSYTPTQTGVHAICPGFRHLDASASELDVRNATLVEGTLADLPHFDGSTGGVWLDPLTGILGTAHASPSVSQAVAWVEEGTTNTVPDPSFEAATITTNWTAENAATISRVSTYAYVGSNAARVSCTATDIDGITQLVTSGAAAANGQVWTIQARVRAFSSGDVGKTMRLAISERTSGDAFVRNNISSTFTLTDAWQSISYTVTLSGGGTTAKVIAKIFNGASVACDFVLDAVQLEQKAYATSYTDGSLGTGYAWSGTAHASSSTRTLATLSRTASSHARLSGGALVARASRLYDPNTDQYVHHLFNGSDGRIYLLVSSDAWAGRIGSHAGLSSGVTATVGEWFVPCVEWDADSYIVRELLSGTASADTAYTGNSSVGTTGYIGGNSVNNIFNGLIGPVLIADRPLTASERARLNGRTLWSWGILRRSGRHLKVV